MKRQILPECGLALQIITIAQSLSRSRMRVQPVQARIAHLLDAGLIEAEQLDATVLLRPTPQGETVISRLRDDKH